MSEGGGDRGGVRWGYSGELGPGHWGSLSPEFALCSAGTEQSPIDIANPVPRPEEAGKLAFVYSTMPLEIVNDGNTIRVNCEGGSAVVVDGRRYELAQFHFHSPSEHTRDGEHSAMELHLVHEGPATGELAVVGVWMEPGDPTPGLDPIWERLPAIPGPPSMIEGVEVDPLALLPQNRSSYRYDGSLTTPPCTEGVSWIMMQAPITVSGERIDAFRALIDGNNRPVQPLNDRTVVAVNEAA